MILLTDSREQKPLIFPAVEGVNYKICALPVGDYGAYLNKDIVLFPTVFERKSIPDLFLSFSSGYGNEKKKIEKASNLGIKLILAIEGTVFDVREGHFYSKDGELKQSKKDGISQIRQLMTMYCKKYFELWWFRSRFEMAFLIQEYFLAEERLMEKAGCRAPRGCVD